jgi:hypothetical protein
MTLIETLLSAKLKETEPTLDLFGADRKVLKIAHEDFENYIKFLAFASGKPLESLENSESEILRSEREYLEEINALLSSWTTLWLKKWKERFNLILGHAKINQPFVSNPETIAKAQVTWSKLECREEIIRMIILSLIKNSELCGTRIIAEDILRRELTKNPNLEVTCTKQVLTLLNAALNKAHETSKRTGPLVYIKVDKNYFCKNC